MRYFGLFSGNFLGRLARFSYKSVPLMLSRSDTRDSRPCASELYATGYGERCPHGQRYVLQGKMQFTYRRVDTIQELLEVTAVRDLHNYAVIVRFSSI